MQKVMMIMEPDSLRDALQRELMQHFEVTVCSNAYDAAALLWEVPDILILDLFLPVMDGLSFLIRNKVHLPPVVVVLSVLTSRDVLQQLADLGVRAVIRKPCTVEAILSVLKTCV